MIENKTRKTRTGNYITYRKIIDVEENYTRGQTKVTLSCGHYQYLSPNDGKDRIKLFVFCTDPKNAVLGCYTCGELNKEDDKNGI